MRPRLWIAGGLLTAVVALAVGLGAASLVGGGANPSNGSNGDQQLDQSAGGGGQSSDPSTDQGSAGDGAAAGSGSVEDRIEALEASIEPGDGDHASRTELAAL